MEKSKPAYDRTGLKFELMGLMAVFVPKVGMRPVCAICGEPILTAPDMHEVLITKGEGRHLPPEVLNSRGNCVLTHPGGKTGGCHSEAHTKAGYVKCVMHIYKRDGGMMHAAKFLALARMHSKDKYGPALKFASALVDCGVDPIEIEAELAKAGW